MVICIIRRRATFPVESIIAATGLSFCVRNENRRFPSAMSTEACDLRPQRYEKGVMSYEENLMTHDS